MRTIRSVMAGGLALAVAAVWTSSAVAHEQRRVGDIEIVVGWADEPTYAGFKNAVDIHLQRDGDPVEDADLEVEVLFGDEDAEERTEPLELRPAFGAPGEYQAAIIPTRPGAYTFHLVGRAGGERVDEHFTSGPDTFDDVHSPSEVQFPAQDPTSGELAQGVQAMRDEQLRLASVARGADEAAATARTMALVAIGLAALGLVAALVVLLRRRPAA